MNHFIKYLYHKLFYQKLYPNELLYCEGRMKPTLRGIFHFYALFFLPFGFYILYSNAITHGATLTSILTPLSSALCLGTSAAYHRLSWSRSNEIFIQKFDHACILFVAFSSYFPLYIFAMPSNDGYFLLLCNLISLLGGFIWILLGKRSLPPILISVGIPFPLFPMIYQHLGLITSILSFSVILFYGIGMAIFKSKYPNPHPHYFGYHEIFHLFVIFSMILTFYVHYRILCDHQK